MRFKAIFAELFYFLHKFLDDIFARNAAHRNAVFEYHPDIPAECNSELRIMSLTRSVYSAAHDGKMQRLLYMSQPPFGLSHPKMQWVIDLFRHQPIGSDHTINVRSL